MIVHFRAHRAALMTISCNSGLEFFRMSKEEEEEEEEEITKKIYKMSTTIPYIISLVP